MNGDLIWDAAIKEAKRKMLWSEVKATARFAAIVSPELAERMKELNMTNFFIDHGYGKELERVGEP